jgi:hypothetical protein
MLVAESPHGARRDGPGAGAACWRISSAPRPGDHLHHARLTLVNICRRIAVMYAGRIVRRVRNDRVHRRGIRTSRARRCLPGDRGPVPMSRPAPRRPPDPRRAGGCSFHPRCSRRSPARAPRSSCGWRARLAGACACRAVALPGAHVNEGRWRRATSTSSTPAAATARPARSIWREPDVTRGGDAGSWVSPLRQTTARAIIGPPPPVRRFRGEPLADGMREHPPPGADDLPGSTGALNAPDALRRLGEGPRVQKVRASNEEAFVAGFARACAAEASSRATCEISGGQRQRVIIAGAMVPNRRSGGVEPWCGARRVGVGEILADARAWRRPA